MVTVEAENTKQSGVATHCVCECVILLNAERGEREEHKYRIPNTAVRPTHILLVVLLLALFWSYAQQVIHNPSIVETSTVAFRLIIYHWWITGWHAWHQLRYDEFALF